MPTEPRSLRILFSMRHLGFFRMYESVVRELATRGHAVHLVIDHGERMGWRKGLDQLLVDHPTVTWSYVRPERVTVWSVLARLVRIWIDVLRYSGQAYDSAPVLRARAEARMPSAMRAMAGTWPFTSSWGQAALDRCLRTIERALPGHPEFDEFLSQRAPDLLLITPLVYLGSPQLELLRSARALGMRNAVCVGSWDHLSSKSIIREHPQRLFVWNETQRAEAISFHGFRADQVTVTGAQCYDQWFGRQPSRTREQFCRDVGLPAERPFLMYVCSALFAGSPSESAFVLEWVDALQGSGSSRLQSLGVLVRPHPARTADWDGVDLGARPHVRLHGANPIDQGTRDDYFDSLFYSEAVVGLNTSAFLEAAIVGRPVLSILLPRFTDNQEGTLHFHYLTQVGGGLLETSRSLDEHLVRLETVLAGERRDPRQFVEAFIRPAGLDIPATGVFADAVETLAASPAPAPAGTPVTLGALRLVLLPVAAIAARVVTGRQDEGEDRTTFELRRARARERQVQQRSDERTAALSRRLAERDRIGRERAARIEAARDAKARLREQKLLSKTRHAAEKRRAQRQKRRRAVVQRLARMVGLSPASEGP